LLAPVMLRLAHKAVLAAWLTSSGS
jgi:hypothetical protein